MTLHIDFIDETEGLTEDDKSLVSRLLTFAAEKEGVENGECSVTFVTDERIQEINREYRQKDQATDVISFAMEELGEDEMEITGESDLERILGDIIISVPKAKEQAEEYGHSFSRELGFLALHGFLHLLGYDHMKESDEAVMFGRQNDILEEFGLSRS
ncbi:rRNA maturation RNase YbeY [Jeotgalibacillus sp. R-1-5s-1]|uniref:rRNA maturation RNase YbeY n=1 Tax=Jeotgalibacillus sp. R-1-5s-1 TaxID=2555897 RepID=UPI00106C9460|nr:rRNA maturation RNase YbeY [Jeotgalibacillus sp. R-1-5s-1]TFD92326.1 rRNA maturation RNase YbeY [Jeotgalibacillus sp. R-1-5s-1]